MSPMMSNGPWSSRWSIDGSRLTRGGRRELARSGERRDDLPMRLLPTTLVGSYPQPDWLIDQERLGSRLPPRVRARELWRVPEPWLEVAQDDATLLAIRDQ